MSEVPMLRVGLLVGRDRSFPDTLIAEVNGRGVGVSCEYVALDGTRMGEVPPYAVLVDHISHVIPYYATLLKTAALAGVVVINNPFWRAADDTFFGASLGTRLGIATPRTVALPNHRFVEGVVSESLRNLTYPLNWQGIVDYVGLPAVLKPQWTGGRQDVTVVHTLVELWAAFNRSGTQNMILQEFIAWEHYVRCICIGQEHILPIRYDPHAPCHARYVVDHAHLDEALGARVVHDARLINRAMGYDMNSVEFAIRAGVPYAINVMNTAPDFDRDSLPPIYVDWVVRHMADLVIARARQAGAAPAPHWRSLMQTMPPLG